MKIRETGNVGINNGGHNAKLEVSADAGEVFRADAQYGAYRVVANQDGVLLGGTVGIGGKVGIGTFEPATEVHIKSAVGAYPTLTLEDADGGFAYLDGSNGQLFFASDNANTQANSGHYFYADGAETLRVTPEGLRFARGDASLVLDGGSQSDVTRLEFQYQGAEQCWLERVHADGRLSFGVFDV